MGKRANKAIVAVSGGPDSVYLLLEARSQGFEVVAAHLNHGTRGRDSDADQRFVEELGRRLGIPVVSAKVSGGPARRRRNVRGAGRAEGRAMSEAGMRKARYRFLESAREATGAERVLVAHTADDQVETVLMRVLEGAGISGLKGIPRKGADGIERPILDVWREDIVKYLDKHNISHRIDRSNLDTRFERNWIRHLLIPLLEKRYGKAVKKRLFALGERFREIDELVEDSAHKWLKKNLSSDGDKEVDAASGTGGAAGGARRAVGAAAALKRKLGERDRRRAAAAAAVSLPRKSYSRLPAVVRMKVLQLLCFQRARVAPNERLLEAMDRLILSGGPSARLAIGKGASLSCRYGEAVLRPGTGSGAGARGNAGMGGAGSAGRPTSAGTAGPLRLDGPGRYRVAGKKGEPDGAADDLFLWIEWEERRGGVPASMARALAGGENAALFARGQLRLPMSVRPLRVGDRIRPFGLDADKKVKEILIDRKVPREERWGRPVVCDADGEILWIPGVVRSAHAPVAAATRRTIVLRMESST